MTWASILCTVRDSVIRLSLFLPWGKALGTMSLGSESAVLEKRVNLTVLESRFVTWWGDVFFGIDFNEYVLTLIGDMTHVHLNKFCRAKRCRTNLIRCLPRSTLQRSTHNYHPKAKKKVKKKIILKKAFYYSQLQCFVMVLFDV